MKKSFTVPLAIILATVVLSLYQGVHHTITGFDVMLAVCIFFLGMLANSGKDSVKQEPTLLAYMMRDPRLQNEVEKLFGESENEMSRSNFSYPLMDVLQKSIDEDKNERCKNLMSEGHPDGHC